MLNDQIALVSGASRGIGQAIADALGEAGATVIGTATSQSGIGGLNGYPLTTEYFHTALKRFSFDLLLLKLFH